jgi:endonuclease G
LPSRALPHHPAWIIVKWAARPAEAQTLVREAYTLNNNSHRKFANWVAYKITKASLASGRSRSWKRDPDLPAADTLAPAAYKGASAALAVDRGHQAPLAGSAPAQTGRR